MAKVNLSGMTVEALMDLRKRVDEMLHGRRAELEKQLRAFGGARVVRGGASALKGRKVVSRIFRTFGWLSGTRPWLTR